MISRGVLLQNMNQIREKTWFSGEDLSYNGLQPLFHLTFMSVTEILQFVDAVVFNKTDKHLDDLQKNIIQEVFKGKTYKEIADSYDYDEDYIGVETRRLFKILSEELKEDITKSNFHWTMERIINSNNFKIVNNFNHTNINYCPNYSPSNREKLTNFQNNSQSYYDLSLAPKIYQFYEREEELKTLSHWIINQTIPLTCVVGIAGIGKTILVRKFLDLNLSQFEVIIWKNIQFYPSFQAIITDILTSLDSFKNLDNLQDFTLYHLFTLLKEKRCLLVLDNLETIFTHGQLVGDYQSHYQDYQSFFKMITENDHQSNIIVISREQSSAIKSLDSDLSPIQCLEVKGLQSSQILENRGLKNREDFMNLIHLYEGNPYYLQDITILIQDVFDGNITDFLAENSLILTKTMQSHFREIFARLSPIEQKIVFTLSQFDESLTKETLKQRLEDVSSMQLINALQSLQQRFLVTKIHHDRIRFNLFSLFKEYIKQDQTVLL